MPEQAREIAGEHLTNKDLVFRVIPATYELAKGISIALGRATENREVYVDLKLGPESAILITRKVPLPPRKGGWVA